MKYAEEESAAVILCVRNISNNTCDAGLVLHCLSNVAIDYLARELLPDI